MRRKVGRVLFSRVTLKNGQITTRERILINAEREKFFVDSVPAEKIKIYMCEDEESVTFGDERFSIWVKIENYFTLPNKFIIEIGDVKFEVEMLFNRRGFWCFEAKKILKAGFVKSGHEVFIC